MEKVKSNLSVFPLLTLLLGLRQKYECYECVTEVAEAGMKVQEENEVRLL